MIPLLAHHGSERCPKIQGKKTEIAPTPQALLLLERSAGNGWAAPAWPDTHEEKATELSRLAKRIPSLLCEWSYKTAQTSYDDVFIHCSI